MTAPVGPYTPVVRAGDWIIVSGQLGLVEGRLVEGGVAAQTRQAVANVAAQLASVGASLGDVAKTLCFLADMGDFAAFNEAYVDGLRRSPPGALDDRCRGLPLGGLVEIEAWAYRPTDVDCPRGRGHRHGRDPRCCSRSWWGSAVSCWPRSWVGT